MLRALQFTPGQGLREGGEELLQDYRPDSPGWLWVDLGGDNADEVRRVLADNFRFSELAITDALRDRHPPKFEQFDDYTFMILRGLHPETTDINFQAITISFFVRPNLLVSRHALRSVSIDGLWKQIVTDKGRTVRHMWHAMYAVSRRIVDRYTNIMLAAEQRIELLEDEMFTSPGDELLAELINYNRNLRKIRRMSTYHQAVFKNLLAEDLPLESHDRHELGDAKEHFDRIASLAALYQ